MIYGNSNDPVFIKKISLRVWTLRDELEAVIAERKETKGEDISLEDLLKEYKSIGSLASLAKSNEDEGTVKDASELDDFGEDEMAKAMAAMNNPEASEESPAEENPSEENSQESAEANTDNETSDASDDDADAMAAAMLEGQMADSAPAPTTPVNNVFKLEVGLESKNGTNIVKQRIPKIPEEKVSVAKAILSEIYMDQMYFFSNKPFMDGQSIVLDFLVPRRFVLNANVIFCRSYNMKSRIISKNRLGFRIGVKFSFLKEGERTILREFVRSIEPSLEAQSAKDSGEVASKEKGGDDFDVFDELDD